MASMVMACYSIWWPPAKNGKRANIMHDRSLYTATDKCLQCLLRIMYTVFYIIGVYVNISCEHHAQWSRAGPELRFQRLGGTTCLALLV